MFDQDTVIIDLGGTMEQGSYPPWGYIARHVDHKQGAKGLANSLNQRGIGAGKKMVESGQFPEALGLAWTSLTLTDHTGTHIDAPHHFGPVVAGKPAKTIDQVPLEWCMGPGVRLDFRNRAGTDISVDDLRRELDRIGFTIRPGVIPLIWTGADAAADTDNTTYWRAQAGLSLKGLYFLLDQGVKLVAIDALAMDVSAATMEKNFLDEDPQFYPAHFAGREREHMHLEKLTNLGAIPRPHGFIFAAFPIKIKGGSAGWVRPVAIVPKAHFDEGGKPVSPA